MSKSSPLQKAQLLLKETQGSPLTLEQRRVKAIELAGYIQQVARCEQSDSERKRQAELAAMMKDPHGKEFTTQMTDECFRSQNNPRVANQMHYLLSKYGVPHFLGWGRRLQLSFFKMFGTMLPWPSVPLARQAIRNETAHVILPGEPQKLTKHIRKRNQDGVRVNLNHIGEAILGENEALRRLNTYIEDLNNPDINYISVKISTICSQLNLIAWDNTLDILASRLRLLFRAARDYTYTRKDGKKQAKFVNLDMEEYRDLSLTVALFRKVLDEPEFLNFSAGIVLQSYLPDSYLIQQELTLWAMKRVGSGGAPIKIRIVKGANLAMEKVDASLRGWPQAPYTSKKDTDTNFKRMIVYGCLPEHATAASLGIGSHNLFDIAYAMLLSHENNVQPFVTFEMLEGMAEPTQRVIQSLSGEMVLYCPAAKKEEFQNAVAYLVRRLDENTAPENFLRQSFNLVPGSHAWNEQATLFSLACENSCLAGFQPRRIQNRMLYNDTYSEDDFVNEPDTDWSLPHNIAWAQAIAKEWQHKEIRAVPITIGSQEIMPGDHVGSHIDPSRPGKTVYEYTLASQNQIDQALNIAKTAEKKLASFEQRASLLGKIAEGLRKKRGELIGAMMADTSKTIYEGDVEVSEAVDFAEYYRVRLLELTNLSDVKLDPKGIVLVAPPWNFPCSIPAGGILAALAAGNSVIFKPAPESILVGWYLVNVFWDAGVDKDLLQFIICEDEPEGSALVKDARINTVILTGGTQTARTFLKLRAGLDLIAETGGKNAIIVSAMADRDLAVKDIVQSAFGHAGQKCSACSLAILESEVYDDKRFREQLKDAVSSLRVGSIWNLATKLNPLIRPPGEDLKRGLTQLDPGEEWLLEPRQDPDNPHLWTPGIKLGVKPGSFTHTTELFGPVLGLIKVNNLKQGISVANSTPYGLTAGIHSLDNREIQEWIKTIDAGNLYVNRGITGAIVQRQPFGGTKGSSFGRGAKAGGPNYILQVMHAEQVGYPEHQHPTSVEISAMTSIMNKNLRGQQLQLWNGSVGSYAYYWNHYFSKKHDPSRVLGQDNYQYYVPQNTIQFRIEDKDFDLDVMRIVAAALTCGTPLVLSFNPGRMQFATSWKPPRSITFREESEEQFFARISQTPYVRIRILSLPSPFLENGLASLGIVPLSAPVLANGRLELLNYLREVSLSYDYHRYGYLGTREKSEKGESSDGHGSKKQNGIKSRTN